MKRIRLIGCLVGLLAAAPAWAAPFVNTTFPRGAGQGEEVAVLFSGTGLDTELVDLLFYDEGIELLGFERPEKYFRADGRETRLAPDRGFKARLKLSPDCRLGEHHFRLLTDKGLSSARTFWVGAFPSLGEKEASRYGEPDNDKLEHATVIESLPVTVNALVYRYDRDHFRVSLKKGQSLTAEIEGMRLGNYARSGLTDLELEIFDAKGTSLLRQEDSEMFLADPLATFTAPADGDYILRVMAQVPGSDANMLPYRLHLGEFDRTVTLPSGGPEAPALDGRPTPNPWRVSDLPNLMEGETGKQFPLALNGVLSEPGEKDAFTIEVPPGEPGPYRMMVYAQALGSPADLLCDIYRVDERGRSKRVAGANDVRAEQRGFVRLDSRVRELLDPAAVVKRPAEGGTYEVRVRDAYDRGGPAYVYRVEFEAAPPEVQICLPPYGNDSSLQIRNRINVPSGAAAPSWLSVKNRFGSPFKGTVQLVAKGLPPGVSFEAPMVEPGMDRVPVRFAAKAGTVPVAALVEIVAEPVEKGVELASSFQQVFNFHSRQNGNCLHHTVVDRLAVCVTPPAPFRLEVDAPDSTLVQEGEYKIPFTVHRESGFEGTVEVTMEWVPPNVSRSTPIKVKKGETRGEFVLSATRRTETGSYPVLLSAIHSAKANSYTRYGAGDHVLASDFFEVNVGEPYVTARMNRAAVERGKTAEVTAKLEHPRPFPGTARVTLRGLPRGVELVKEFRPVAAGAETISFEVRATPSALTGMNRGVHCIFEFEHKGEVVRQKAGYGYLRIDPERQTSSLP